MKISTRLAAPALLGLAGLLSAAFSASAMAQTLASDAGATSASAPAAAHAMPKKHMRRNPNRPAFVEERLNELHSKLKITSAQSSQWDAFAQTMRDSAAKTQAAYEDRATKLAGLNADDAMKSYATLAQLHADNTAKLSQAFTALYATFSDEQKATADVMFRNQPGKRHGPAHRPKGESAAPAAASAPTPASS